MDKKINSLINNKDLKEISLKANNESKVVAVRLSVNLYKWVIKTADEYNKTPSNFIKTILELASKK
ncbi:MAG: hypothetical protein LBV53_00215 [Mycoplasmataceae bacterium]|nr:hypothetical protein [Mycoplasmataceae bacterium]